MGVEEKGRGVGGDLRSSHEWYALYFMNTTPGTHSRRDLGPLRNLQSARFRAPLHAPASCPLHVFFAPRWALRGGHGRKDSDGCTPLHPIGSCTDATPRCRGSHPYRACPYREVFGWRRGREGGGGLFDALRSKELHRKEHTPPPRGSFSPVLSLALRSILK